MTTIKDFAKTSGRSYPEIEKVDMQKTDLGVTVHSSAKKHVGNGMEKVASVHLNGNH